MAYGTLKCDNITFTNGGIDQTVTVSGIVQSISGNITATGTIQGQTIIGTSTVSGATVTGNVGVFTTVTGGSAGFTTVTGTTVTGTTANFVNGTFSTQVSGTTVRGTTVSGATVTGAIGQFTTLTGGTAGFTTVTGATVTGTTANFQSGVFTTQISGATVTGNVGSFSTITGGTVTLTSGVFGTGTAAAPSIAFTGDSNTGIYSPGADEVAVSAGGIDRLFVKANGNVGVGTSNPTRILDVSATGKETYIRLNQPDSSATNTLRPGIFLAKEAFTLLTITCDGDSSATGLTYYDAKTSTGAHVFITNNSEKARIDSSGRLLVGTSTALSNTYIGASVIGPAFQVEGNSGSTAALSITRQTGAAANIILQRGVTGTPVAINHAVGQVNFNGFDGTNFRTAAQITAEVDGTPGVTDMPGRLVFLPPPTGRVLRRSTSALRRTA
jgi:hypothetical protein